MEQLDMAADGFEMRLMAVILLEIMILEKQSVQ